jgi:four helix bundle suffix protein
MMTDKNNRHTRKTSQSPSTPEPLIPNHGGFRNLKSFQMAQLVYDVTVRFCDRYVDKKSRTHDQMVQAARSGVQNIAEGSQASGTSKKTELKLTNVARASLEELRLDYQDFLRHRGFEAWPPSHPALQRFRAKRCSSLDEVRAWVDEELRLSTLDHTTHAPPQASTADRPTTSIPPSILAANAALSLLNLCCYLLDRQIAAQAAAFEDQGGFTERLYRVRQDRRQRE